MRTPFGYFRPLTLGSYGAELRVWGFSPVAFHLTGTRDPRLDEAIARLALRSCPIGASFGYGQATPDAAISASREPCWGGEESLYVPFPAHALTGRTTYQ